MECLDVVLLQETLIRATDLRPKFQGYRDFFAYGDQVASERGCCIIVKDTLRARTVGNSSPCWISVRLEDEDVAKSTIFVSVYMPSGRQGEPYRNNLRAELRRLRESFPNDRLVVGGDWNLDEDGICDLLSEWDIDIPGVHTLWPIDSSSRTRGTCMY
jgi:exonuclease III